MRRCPPIAGGYLSQGTQGKRCASSRTGIVALFVTLLGFGIAQATPYEITVLTDDLTEPGDHAFELHLNLAKPGPRADSASGRVTQSLFEYSFGLSKTTQISAQLPVSRVTGRWYASGIRAELQYVATHDDDDGGYWGVRGEVGHDKPVGAASVVAVEVLPIIGYRAGRWHFAANPSLNKAITGNNRRIQFDPAAKLVYRVADHQHFGVEYYVEAGSLRDLLPRQQRSEVGYLVWDGVVGRAGFNVGFGRHMTSASDRWVVKMIISAQL